MSSMKKKRKLKKDLKKDLDEVREISQMLSPLVTDLTFSFYFRMERSVYNIEETKGKGTFCTF